MQRYPDDENMDIDFTVQLNDNKEVSRMSNRKNSQQKYLEEINKSQKKKGYQSDDCESLKEIVQPEKSVNKLEQLLQKAEQYANFLLTRSKKINENYQKKIEKEQNLQTRRKQKHLLDQEVEVDPPSNSEQEENYTRLECQPSILEEGTIKEFQLLGLNWMISLYESGINGILADEMGLGKTIQSIAMLGYLLQKGIKGPFLVIAPKSTLGNWQKELDKWLPALRVVKLIAIKQEREDIIKNQLQRGAFDLCLTSYEGVNICISNLVKFDWHFMVIDEAHRLKNDISLLSRNVRKLKSYFKILLTGTPLQNNLHELWSLLNFIMPELFDDGEVFESSQSMTQSQTQDADQQSMTMIKQLHSILRPFMLRRTKKEVDSTILPKKEIYIYVGLSAVQITMYKSLLLKKSTGINDDLNKSYYNNLLMQLRKLCNHPYIFDNVEEEDADPMGDHLVSNSGKLVVLDQLLSRLDEEGNHQILIFSQMTRMLDILEDYCNIRHYKYCRIDGDTDMYSRDVQINDFSSAGSDKYIFLLSTRAGGLGINLATADTVVLYDSDWNPQMDLQAMDRAHRIGQKRQVNVYRFISENTIEEKMIERQIVKLKWDSLVIQSGRQAQNKNMSKEQLKEMIQFGAQQIFKASESGQISQESLDNILERGAQKINEYKDQIQTQMDNIMDLSLNQMDLYHFQNENYSRKKAQDQEVMNQRMVEQMDQDFLLRTRREKKIIYNEEEIQYVLKNCKPKQKKEIRLGEHQLYKNKDRLIVLMTKQQTTKLDTEEEQEKHLLQEEGFINWNKEDYNNFIRGCEKFGKQNIIQIHEVYLAHKDYQEVEAYSKRFFEELDNLSEKENIVKRIQKGEKAQWEKIQIQGLLEKKCKSYRSVMAELDFQSNSGYKNLKNSFYQLMHDRCILLHTWKQGYGEWENVLRQVKQELVNRFDSFIRSRNANDIHKRVQKLVKIIQKEQEENQLATTKKNQTIDLYKLKQDLINQQVNNQNQQFHMTIPTPIKNINQKNKKKQMTIFEGFQLQNNGTATKQVNNQSSLVQEYENSQKNNSNRKQNNSKRNSSTNVIPIQSSANNEVKQLIENSDIDQINKKVKESGVSEKVQESIEEINDQQIQEEVDVVQQQQEQEIQIQVEQEQA